MGKEWLGWLQGPAPWEELRDRRASGWLDANVPELARLYGVPQALEHHPESDTGRHTELVLEEACRISAEPATRFAALVHDLGKGVTDPGQWPRHVGHELAGVPLVEAVIERFDLPDDWRELAVLATRCHLRVHRIFDGPARTTIRLFRDANLFARPHLVAPLLEVCEADKRGRGGHRDRDYPQAAYLLEAFRLAGAVSERDGEERTHPARIAAIAELRRSFA